ncbi:CoA transferase, partial [Escherichia coli]|nr:CoA transferase [Escherichia coli]
MTNNECKGPFEGLLVIDMTHVLNWPFGTQLLCNMGARVIKVEPPVRLSLNTVCPLA